MKSLIAIYVAGAVVIITGTAWVNSQINALSVGQRVQPFVSTEGVNPQLTVSSEALQPALKVEPNFTSTLNPQETVNAKALETAKL